MDFPLFSKFFHQFEQNSAVYFQFLGVMCGYPQNAHILGLLYGAFLLANQKKLELGIYIFYLFVYDRREQSRRPRVKCCQNGELSDRRRALPAMR